MDGTLKLIYSSLAFSGPNTATRSNKNFFDWNDEQTVSVNNPKGQPYTVDPGSSLQVFSGVRSILSDGTTQWTLAVSSLGTDRYRFTNSSGTAPGLRTARTLTLVGAVAVTVNANQTATFSAAASTFGAVQVGDTVFVPGASTGDSVSPFNTLNEGFWTVLAVAGDGSNVQLVRPTGTPFSAYGESQTPDATHLLAFSAAGVQIGDGVDISAGFAQPVLKGYRVVAVTPKWFEVNSTAALPVSAVAIPGALGIQFYFAAKRWVELYADQECVLRLNGDTGDSNKVSPWQAGDNNQMGHFAKSGLAWSATVVNKSTQPLNIQFISAE